MVDFNTISDWMKKNPGSMLQVTQDANRFYAVLIKTEENTGGKTGLIVANGTGNDHVAAIISLKIDLMSKTQKKRPLTMTGM